MSKLTSAEFVDAGRAVAIATEGIPVKVGARVFKRKVPNGLTRRYVDPSGNVVYIQLSDGALRRSVANRQYRESIVNAAHFIPYGECAVRSGVLDEKDMPESLRHVCPQGSYSEDKACPHVEWAIAERRAEHERKEREREVKSKNELDLEMRKQEIELSREAQRQTQELLQRIAGSASVAAAQRGNGK